MYPIDNTTSVPIEPSRPEAGPPGFFTSGVPGDPNFPATIVPHWWLNMLQKEMLSVLQAAGIDPDKGIDTQFGQAVAALAGSVPTGSVMWSIKTAAPLGWLFMNGQTVGNPASGADHAGAFQALYTDLYGLDNLYAPVIGGRSGVALDDFNAGKPITLLEATGRALIGAGLGTGLTINHPLGSTIGEESHTQTLAELVAHTHGMGREPSGGGVNVNRVESGGNDRQTSSTGSSLPSNIIQPSLVLNVLIKI